MTEVVRMAGVSVRRGSTSLLAGVDLVVHEGERWILMGPNGAGKTTLMLVAAARLFPTLGEVELLGEVMGAVDVAELRQRIGWASSTVAADLPAGESVLDVVLTGAWAVSGRWREAYEPGDEARAHRLLEAWGMGALAGRTFGTLSEGERKRTMIARAVMSDPELLLLDEPGAGLDLGGREDLVDRLAALAADEDAPTLMVVTHHVEEIPPGFTHIALLGGGRIVGAGPLQQTLTDAAVSEAFAAPMVVRLDDGRWTARRRAAG